MKVCSAATTRDYCSFSLLHPPHQLRTSPSLYLIRTSKTLRSLQWRYQLPNSSIAQRPNQTATTVVACYGDKNPAAFSPAKRLRQIIGTPGIHQGPACFDALSAKLVEQAGFDYCFTTGFGISAARLGLPDTGFLSYGEMLDQGQQITGAVSIPVIGDGDNGYGNAINVKRTVKGFIKAGFAGIILEDQSSPKACGHTQGRAVVSREEAITRVKAAVDARRESGSDIVIVTRTDSRQAISFDESLWRSRAFADAGADVLFVDALTSKEEMRAFCETSLPVPKMANMLEGGGKTPILNPSELADVGYKLVAYPLSLIGVSVQAMQAGFLERIANMVPALGGVNIKGLLDDAAEGGVGGKLLLLDFKDTVGDRIQLFLE